MAENASALNIDINTNFLASKTLWLAITKKEASAAIDLVMEEIIQGCNFNKEDLWLYILAFEMLATSFKTDMDEQQREMYEAMLKRTRTITFINDERCSDDD